MGKKDDKKLDEMHLCMRMQYFRLTALTLSTPNEVILC